MWWRRTAPVAVVLPVALIVGAAIWFMAMKGSADDAESMCIADLATRPTYGGYSMSGGVWPPSFECRLRGVGVPELTISHPFAGLAVAIAAVVVPATLLAGTIASVWWAVRRRPGGLRIRQSPA